MGLGRVEIRAGHTRCGFRLFELRARDQIACEERTRAFLFRKRLLRLRGDALLTGQRIAQCGLEQGAVEPRDDLILLHV